MSKKVVEIEYCYECPFFDDLDNCSKYGKYIETSERFNIPTWCELPDAKEEK